MGVPCMCVVFPPTSATHPHARTDPPVDCGSTHPPVSSCFSVPFSFHSYACTARRRPSPGLHQPLPCCALGRTWRLCHNGLPTPRHFCLPPRQPKPSAQARLPSVFAPHPSHYLLRSLRSRPCVPQLPNGCTACTPVAPAQRTPRDQHMCLYSAPLVTNPPFPTAPRPALFSRHAPTECRNGLQAAYKQVYAKGEHGMGARGVHATRSGGVAGSGCPAEARLPQLPLQPKHGLHGPPRPKVPYLLPCWFACSAGVAGEGGGCAAACLAAHVKAPHSYGTGAHHDANPLVTKHTPAAGHVNTAASLPLHGCRCARPAAACSSQRAAYSCCRRCTVGPRAPLPMRRPSTSVTGICPAKVPVTKASSALYTWRDERGSVQGRDQQRLLQP